MVLPRIFWFVCLFYIFYNWNINLFFLNQPGQLIPKTVWLLMVCYFFFNWMLNLIDRSL